MSRKTGKEAEQHAKHFLEQQKLQVIEENYSALHGEIDLICLDPLQRQIVFVEVKYRKTNTYGSSLESVNYHKQKVLSRTALYFLQQKKWLNLYSVRFDVISIDTHPTGKIQWIQSAFDGILDH